MQIQPNHAMESIITIRSPIYEALLVCVYRHLYIHAVIHNLYKYAHILHTYNICNYYTYLYIYIHVKIIHTQGVQRLIILFTVVHKVVNPCETKSTTIKHTLKWSHPQAEDCTAMMSAVREALCKSSAIKNPLKTPKFHCNIWSTLRYFNIVTENKWTLPI